MPSSAYAAFSTVSLLPVPMAIRGGLAVSVRGRVSSSTPWSQLAATFLGVDAGVDILQLKTRVGLRKFPVAGFALAVLRRNLASGSASVSVFSRHVPDPSVIVALEGTGRGGCCSREPRRPAGGGLGTAKCVASTARKSCPPAPPIAAMCWAACRRARSRLRGQSVSLPPRRTVGPAQDAHLAPSQLRHEEGPGDSHVEAATLSGDPI